MTDGILGHISFEYPTFPENTEPKGLLPPDKAAQACWYYMILAEKQRQNVGRGPEDQIIVVDTGHENDVHWMDTHYGKTLQSIALIYGIGDPQLILNYWPAVIRECDRMGVDHPHSDYMNPRRWLQQ